MSPTLGCPYCKQALGEEHIARHIKHAHPRRPIKPGVKLTHSGRAIHRPKLDGLLAERDKRIAAVEKLCDKRHAEAVEQFGDEIEAQYVMLDEAEIRRALKGKPVSGPPTWPPISLTSGEARPVKRRRVLPSKR